MRIALYLDIYPGMDTKWATATANPGKKTEGCKRYKITVGLPDPNEPDDEREGLASEVKK